MIADEFIFVNKILMFIINIFLLYLSVRRQRSRFHARPGQEPPGAWAHML